MDWSRAASPRADHRLQLDRKRPGSIARQGDYIVSGSLHCVVLCNCIQSKLATIHCCPKEDIFRTDRSFAEIVGLHALVDNLKIVPKPVDINWQGTDSSAACARQATHIRLTKSLHWTKQAVIVL